MLVWPSMSLYSVATYEPVSGPSVALYEPVSVAVLDQVLVWPSMRRTCAVLAWRCSTLPFARRVPLTHRAWHTVPSAVLRDVPQ